jgi:hypothetical protein
MNVRENWLGLLVALVVGGLIAWVIAKWLDGRATVTKFRLVHADPNAAGMGPVASTVKQQDADGNNYEGKDLAASAATYKKSSSDTETVSAGLTERVEVYVHTVKLKSGADAYFSIAQGVRITEVEVIVTVNSTTAPKGVVILFGANDSVVTVNF